jgi:hypothetical protein
MLDNHTTGYAISRQVVGDGSFDCFVQASCRGYHHHGMGLTINWWYAYLGGSDETK